VILTGIHGLQNSAWYSAQAFEAPGVRHEKDLKGTYSSAGRIPVFYRENVQFYMISDCASLGDAGNGGKALLWAACGLV
jgi:hypothetical protein